MFGNERDSRRRHSIRSLQDTITRLARIRVSALQEPAWTASTLSVLDNFGPNPGNLHGKFYVPKSFVKGSALVVVLHGCTQSPEGYDRGAGWSKAADEHGFALLFPEQQRANNPKLCFNWFLPTDVSRDQGEARSIREMVAEMHARFETDPARVFVTGLSAGGAMAAVMLASYPEIFAGGGIIAGLPFGSAHSVPEAFDRMRGHGGPSVKALSEVVRSASSHSGPWPTLSIWHGTGDTTVDPSNAQDLVDQWRTLHGASKLPCKTDEVEGFPHRVWCDPAGREVIEEFAITGFAHGTPLDVSHPEFGELAGPYMLDAGISSPRHILRFWGRKPAGAKASHVTRPVERRPRAASRSSTSRRPQAVNPTANVTRTIEEALRAAGLLR